METSRQQLLCWQLRQPLSANSIIGYEANRSGDSSSAQGDRISGQADGIHVPQKITAGSGRFGIRYDQLDSGRSTGLSCLTIDTGSVTATILPDRGMGLWKCWSDELEFGWQSPVSGPVHPNSEPVHDASGIGW